MALVKQKSRRKRYATEFLIRTDNPTLVADLKKVADKRDQSVNIMVVEALEKIIEKSRR